MYELLDIVNEYDEVIGQQDKSLFYAKNLSSFRVINAFLMNDARQLWIPRRTAQKKLFPLCLDASVGGHVMSGESYCDAFKRELYEELNIGAQDISYQKCFKLNPYHHKVSAHMYVYLVNTNISPGYNQSDFVEGYWMDIEALTLKIESGESTKGDLPIMVRYLKNFIEFQQLPHNLTSMTIE